MNADRLRIRWRAAQERFRGSLFYLPALYVIGAALLAGATTWFDRIYASELPGIPLLLPTTVPSARAILSTIAAATITVAGVVFSLTVIAVQLASSQFSPRVLRGFLRDRFSQRVIGVVMATFTYCLLVLATLPAPRDGETVQNVSVTFALVLAVLAVLAIVAFLDHSARSMQVGEVIRRSSDETRALIREHLLELGEGVDPAFAGTRPDDQPDLQVTARTEGWVQQIDDSALLAALPEGAVLHVCVRAGSYVTPATLLAEVWSEGLDEDDADEVAGDVRGAVHTGHERTMQQDMSFGIRQLVDIALRALSPGINDPTTAIEVIYRLGGLIEEILVHDLPALITSDEEGRRVVRTAEVDHDRLVRYAFRQIRVAGIDQPAVIDKLVQVLGELHVHAQREGLQERATQLAEEARLAVTDLEAHVSLKEDAAPIRRTARRFGLLGGDVR